ncbi:13391_t:CDS:2, partial [Dentiscutata heterogama]
DENWAHKMESNIKELTKAVMDLTEHNRTFNSRRNQRSLPLSSNHNVNNQNQAPRPHRCYECNQEGHIARYCPNRLQQQNNNQSNKERNNQTLNQEVRGLNVRLFEVKETSSSEINEYLMIKVEGSDMLFDIRNLGKRRRCDDENEMPTWANIEQTLDTNRTKKTKDIEKDYLYRISINEIQPIEAENLQGSSYHGRIIYWHSDMTQNIDKENIKNTN